MTDETQGSGSVAAGSSAPPFSLPARSGKTVSLQDFAGKNNVLVYFYPKDDTPGCTKEACSLRDSWKQLQDAGIVVLGISRDDGVSHNAFAAKYNLPFELLTDADHSVHEAYKAWGQNPNPAWGVGPLRKSYLIGKDGRIRHVFDKVDTEHHAAQVLSAMGITVQATAPQAPMSSAPAASAATAAQAMPKPVAKPAAPPAPMTTAVAPVPPRVVAPAPTPMKAPAPAPAPTKAAPKPAVPAPGMAAPPKPAVKPAAKPAAKAAPKMAKPAGKKTAPAKKATVKKPVKKATPKKAAPKKAAPKKATRKKAAARKPAPKKAGKKKAPARKAGKAPKSKSSGARRPSAGRKKAGSKKPRR